MKTIANVILGAALPFACFAAAAAGQTAWYVDDDNCPGVGTGTQGDPFCKLRDALSVATAGDEIRVVEGTYAPLVPGALRSAGFFLINGVGIYGGFPAGGGGGTFEARNPAVFVTTLTGDLNGDDSTGGDNSENSYHVVTVGAGIDGSAVLDGFTITAGNADAANFPDDAGGGMRIQNGSPTIVNCTFHRNHAVFGGGMENFNGGDPTIVDCTFSENTASFRGAGLHDNASAPHLLNCTFIGNNATNSGGGMRSWNDSRPTVVGCTFTDNFAGFGGAMVNDNTDAVVTRCIFSGNTATGTSGGMHNYRSDPLITNCTFIGNSAAADGGAMYNLSGSRPTLEGCLFAQNAASFRGGALRNLDQSVPIMINCTISNNVAGIAGGGMFNTDAVSTLANSILWGNVPDQIVDGSNAFLTVVFSDVQGGWTGTGSDNIDADPLFADADLDFRLTTDSPCIDAGVALVVTLDTDLDGNPRIAGAAVDMGAFEFQQPGQPIPSVSQWGIISLTLLLVTGLTTKFRRPIEKRHVRQTIASAAVERA